MGLIGKIFGTKDAVDAVKDGVDAVFFTPEEKARHMLDLLKAYEPFKLIQRVLASMVTAVYLGIWVISAIIYISSLFFDPCETACAFSQFQEVSKDLSKMNNDTLGLPFATIMALYFGGGMLNGALRSKNGTK
jgi:hypothetical protein